jgi:hypothetical protein
LKAKNNVAENLLKESNNQLQAHCLELFSNKRTLLKRDKELGFTKVQILKLWTENKHLVAKGVKAEKAIKKVEVLQQYTTTKMGAIY